MLLHVHCECVCFFDCSACLVIGLGAGMMGRASAMCVSMGSCEGMAFACSPSLSITLCLSTLCLGTLCLGGGFMEPFANLPLEGQIHARGE